MSSMKMYNKEELLDKLRSKFQSCHFEFKEMGFYTDGTAVYQLFIKSEGHDEFKTTIKIEEFPLPEEQAESICGIIDGTIQLLKWHNMI